MRINVIGHTYTAYLLSKVLNEMGSKSLFFSEAYMHPRLSLAWEFTVISDEDLEMIRVLDFENTSPLGPGGSTIISTLQKESDFLVCMGLGAYWAMLAGIPYIYYSFGGDLSRWPFKRDTPQDRERSVRMRAVLEHARGFLGMLHSKKHQRLPELLGLDPSLNIPWMQPVDCGCYAPRSIERRALNRAELGAGDDFIVYMGSQLLYKPTPELNAGKGSDVFLKGFKRFVQQYNGGVQLWVCDRGWQRREFRELVGEMGLNDHVTWLPVVSKEKMVETIDASDAVFDQIYPPIANHGALALETMAVAKPVLSYIDQEHRASINEPPIPNVNVLTAEDVAAALERLASDPAERQRVGQAGRDFVREHHDWPVAAKRLREICNAVMATPREGADQGPLL